MKVGVLGTKAKIKYENVVHEFVTYLQSLGYQAVEFDRVQDVCDVDVVVVLGGDGAILHAALTSAQNGIKIVGVNYGSLGFLTEFEKDEKQGLADILAQFEKGDCRIVKRSLLQVEIGGKTHYALNEVALHRDCGYAPEKQSQLLKMKAHTKAGAYSVAGDGALICTPTGSTAYSLSAGGAILTPEVPVFMLTPICAFSMRARPIVFSNDEEVALQVEKGRAAVTIDGLPITCLPEAATIFIKKAPFTADFLVKDNSDFFTKVKTKLNE